MAVSKLVAAFAAFASWCCFAHSKPVCIVNEKLDLSEFDSNLTGFRGTYAMGGWLYMVPNRNTWFTRVFSTNFSFVEVLDLGEVDLGLSGFWGGFATGSKAYMAPYDHGKLVSVDILKDGAKSWLPEGVAFFDLTTRDPDLRGFRGSFNDNQYGYLVPYVNSKVLRFRLYDGLKFPHLEILDLNETVPGLRGFEGGLKGTSRGYLAPRDHGTVVRFSLATFNNTEVLDLTEMDASLHSFCGGFTTAYYAYFWPCGSGTKLVRLNKDMYNLTGVEVLDAAPEDPEFMGYMGGFSDGSRAYLWPTTTSPMLQVPFIDLNNWGSIEFLNESLGSEFGGFAGSFFDGTYSYLTPNKHHTVFRLELSTIPDTTPKKVGSAQGVSARLAVFVTFLVRSILQ